MAAYRRVYDSRHLQADCRVPGSACLRRASESCGVCTVVNGTTGECNSLTVLERKQLAEKWTSVGRGRYVHTNHPP